MRIALLSFAIGLLGSAAFFFVALRAVTDFWKRKAEYTTERIEKACDSVTSFVAFLIPATLAVTTWVYEKTGTLWYGAFLALSTIWFLVVLISTMYMRFNFVWSLPEKVTVGDGQNMEVPRWLTTVMVGLTVGLFFLAIPTFVIAFRASPEKAKNPDAQLHYEYYMNQAGLCQPCPTPESSVQEKTPIPKSAPKQKKER